MKEKKKKLTEGFNEKRCTCCLGDKKIRVRHGCGKYIP